MNLIKKLQECKSIEEANPILAKLKARPSAKKLVETAIILSNSDDPQQKDHAFQFMATAIKELEDDGDKKKSDHFEETDDDDDLDGHKLHEEELKNHNNGQREEGSEQSSQNVEPYTGEGKDTTNGEKPMQDMDGTTNQWNETGPPGMPGQMPGGMPGQQQQPPMGQMPGQLPGLDPSVAQEMGMIMPNLPPMDTNQMMRQMQYTINKTVETLHRKEIVPLQKMIIQQKEAIKSLSIKITETAKSNHSMTLDIDTMRKNASASFREIESSPMENNPMYMGKPMSGLQPNHTRKKDQLDMARSEITEMDKIIRSENSTIYG